MLCKSERCSIIQAVCRCSHVHTGAFPVGANAGVQYGPRAQAAMLHLSYRHAEWINAAGPDNARPSTGLRRPKTGLSSCDGRLYCRHPFGYSRVGVAAFVDAPKVRDARRSDERLRRACCGIPRETARQVHCPINIGGRSGALPIPGTVIRSPTARNHRACRAANETRWRDGSDPHSRTIHRRR